VQGRAGTAILVVAAVVQHVPARSEAGVPECLIGLSSSASRKSNAVYHITI